MGSTTSKDADPIKNITPPKPGQIDVMDKSKLVKLDVKPLNIPKPPAIKTGADIEKEKKEEETRNLVSFDISKDYDMEKMSDRFLK